MDFYNYTNGTSSDNCTDQSVSTYFQTTAYFMYTVVFVISVFGNGTVCYIVVSSPRMRTVTNYFIMNLAVGDMLITVLCIPFTAVSTLMQYWPFDVALCPVVNYFQGVSVFVSAYTLVAISVDRYIAIMWPLRPRLSKKSSAVVILTVWAFSTLTALPMAISSRTVQPHRWFEECNLYMCQEDWSNIGMEYEAMYTRVLAVLQYLIPLSVLVFTYTSIAVMIWCHRIPGEAENCRDQRIARSKRKMIKMMITVVVVYTICWLPLNLFWVIEFDADSIHPKLLSYLWFFSHWFAMSHTCYNPIIYCYMNTRFRAGFLQAFGSVPCARRCCESYFHHHHHHQSTALPLTSMAGTDSTVLQRNNTCTTYVSTRRKNGRLSTSFNLQAPIRSASMMRTTQTNNHNHVQQQQQQQQQQLQQITKRRRYSSNVTEDEI